MIDATELKAFAQSVGFDLVGICPPDPPPHLDQYRHWLERGYHGEMGYLERHLPLKADPRHLLADAQSILVLGMNYNQPNPAVPGQPRIARYALGRDYHRVIRGRMRRIIKWLQEHYPDSHHRACVDSAPICERDYANLAGLGWFGKNTMIINSQRGSWFFLATLLTSVAFERDRPATGGCGTCRRCIDACPTGAIVYQSGHWQVDARRCISYQTIEKSGELEVETDGWTFGCDVCQEVCPFNEPRPSQPLRAQPTAIPDFLNVRQWPDLKHLAVLQASEWEVLTEGSATRRTGLAGLRRNAQANLKSQ